MKAIQTIHSTPLSDSRIIFVNGLSVILGRAISWFVILRNLTESGTDMVRSTHKHEVCQLFDSTCQLFCIVYGRSCMLSVFTDFEALNRLLNLSLLSGGNNNNRHRIVKSRPVPGHSACCSLKVQHRPCSSLI